MVMDLRFAVVCQKQWNELQGTDPNRRFCTDCSRDIINLDVMTESEREQLFLDARKTGVTPCVFATVRNPNLSSCQDALVEEEDYPQVVGQPDMDPDLPADFFDADDEDDDPPPESS